MSSRKAKMNIQTPTTLKLSSIFVNENGLQRAIKRFYFYYRKTKNKVKSELKPEKNKKAWMSRRREKR